jgi:hypothetical protein
MLHRRSSTIFLNGVIQEPGMVGPVIRQAAQIAARTAAPAARTALAGAAAAAQSPAARQGMAGLASRASTAAASGAGRAGLNSLRAALPGLGSGIKKTAGEFAEAAALDGLSSLTGLHANTSPSVGGAAYDLAKAAATPNSPPKTMSASPAATMAAGRLGATTPHQPPAALANHQAFAAVGRPAGAPIGGGSPAMRAFLNANKTG